VALSDGFRVGRRPSLGLRTVWGAYVLVAVWGAPLAAQTPAGTPIPNRAVVTFVDGSGTPDSAFSNTVTVTVGRAGGITLVAPTARTANPGDTVIISHTLTNAQNADDTFGVTAVSAAGWTATVFRDANGDGLLDPADPPWAGTVGVPAGSSTGVLVALEVPASATPGTADLVTLTATSATDPSIVAALDDTVTVGTATVVTLNKQVDRPTATAGDALSYAIGYTASGAVSATNAVVTDTIPDGTSYVAGSLTWNGMPLTDAPGDDAGEVNAGSGVIVVRLGDLPDGASGTVGFRATVEPGAGPTVTNFALAEYGTGTGLDTAVSDTTVTGIEVADLTLDKLLETTGPVQYGDLVAYRLSYRNTSATIDARNVVLVDTLPAGVAYESAAPAAQVDGAILSWALGDVAAGASGEVQLSVRVTHAGTDTLAVRNLASLAGTNSGLAMAAATTISVVNQSAVTLGLTKSAGLLEVGLGEVAPFTLAVENPGALPLTDVVVRDSLPEGGRYVEGSTTGADSAVVAGGWVTFFVAGPIDPGATHVIRYQMAVVSAESDLLQNTAVATAAGGVMQSAPAVAWVRVRRGYAMETRAVIGKVWADLDDDGIQDPGEPGVGGVEIRTVDGEVATTDHDGRFSLRNRAPGRQGYRLDPSTLPLEYGVADDAPADLELRDATGWTTPRVVFRVVPRAARLAGVRLPVPWQFHARPIAAGRDSLTAASCSASAPAVVPDADKPVELRGVTFGFDRADLTEASRTVLDEVVAILVRHPALRVEVAGHADSSGVAVYNEWLSAQRAVAVKAYLVTHGIVADRLDARGYGMNRPVASNATAAGRARNRRVELHVIGRTTDDVGAGDELRNAIDAACAQVVAEYAARSGSVYETEVENPYGEPVEGLVLAFLPAADSIRVVVAGSLNTVLLGSTAPLPPVAAGERILVRAWSSVASDSASAVLRSTDTEERLTAEVHNPLRPVAGRGAVTVRLDSLPPVTALPAGGRVEAILVGSGAAREIAWAVPAGWVVDSASGRDSAGAPVPLTVSRDRQGAPAAFWHASDAGFDPITVALHAEAADAEATETEAVTVSALRSDDERSAERRRAITSGPGIEFFAPADGSVLATDRLFVGVKGQAGQPVSLFDGDSLLGEATLRPDGVHDFVGVRLAAGPHRLRVRMRNSWQQERWDSLAVHVSGAAAAFAWDRQRLQLTADGHSEATVSVRVVDAWTVPVTNRPFVTVAADGAEVASTDADPSSVGMQLQPDASGWLRVRVRAGYDVGPGTLRFTADSARVEVPLEVTPALKPFMLTAIGRVGVGANPENFGALSARGRLDRRTSVLVSYDSRGLGANRDAFGRVADPLEAAQYPLLGDAGLQRTLTASRGHVAARLERGYDWLAVGDVTTGFAQDLSLARYGRTLTGASARVTTGPVVFHGFGASTSRRLQQAQLRGQGNAGPYELTAGVDRGTEIVVIETRAFENPERVVSRQSMLRYVDYQIDYTSGALLFKRPVPASDTYGNPVFVVVTYEADGGGDASAVFGLRAATDLRNVVGHRLGLDSLGLGATWVHDGAAVGGTYTLVGGDVRVRHGGLDLGLELSAAESPDSSGIATAIDGTYRLGRDAQVTGRWLHLGAGFHNPSSVALRGGTDEIGIGARAKLAGTELKLDHSWQRFSTEGVNRNQTRGTAARTILPGLTATAGVSADRMENGAALNRSEAGEFELAWQATNAVKVWGEGRTVFGSQGSYTFPAHVGAGASLKLTDAITVEGRHRQAFLPNDSGSYGITNVGLRTQLGEGTQAWGQYQLAGVNGAYNAAVVGLNSRMHLGSAWTVSGMFERRVGLGRAALEDPVRALPFVQAEDDYWSFGAGAELLPLSKPYRASARAELREGQLRSTRLLSAAGSLSFSEGLALLSRQEFVQDRTELSIGLRESRRLWSLWGLAFRPTRSDRWNLLGKVEWLDTYNPQASGVLTSEGDENRLIVAGEAVYEATARLELAGRYAVRRATATLRDDTGFDEEVVSFAHFMGWRAQLDWRYGVGVRADMRSLLEQSTGTLRYDVAPQLVFGPIPGLELAAGYRFGTLRDPDFAVSGGPGFFLTIGAQVTERTLESAADYWFSRLGRRE